MTHPSDKNKNLSEWYLYEVCEESEESEELVNDNELMSKDLCEHGISYDLNCLWCEVENDNWIHDDDMEAR